MGTIARHKGGTLKQIEQGLACFSCLSPTHFPNHFAQVFLVVAQHQPITYAELEKAMGLSNSAISRTIAALGKEHRKGTPGYGLCDVIKDPAEGRRHLVMLTPKGEALKRQLLSI